MNTKQVKQYKQVRMSAELHKLLRKLAFEQEKSISKVVGELYEFYKKQHQK